MLGRTSATTDERPDGLHSGVDVAATEEVAAPLAGIFGVKLSGFSNAGLSAEVDGSLERLPEDGLAEDVTEGVVASGLLSAAAVAGRVLREGRPSRRESAAMLGDVAVGTVTATTLDALPDLVS